MKVSAAGYDTKQESIVLKTGEIVNRSIGLTERQVVQPTVTNFGFKCGTDKLVDTRDGNQYETVQIGDQCWMKENLKWLPSVTPPTNGSNTSAYYYVFDYQSTSVSSAKATTNYQIYGVLYNWPAALNACPNGWHLPSENEWKVLFNYLGGGDVAGGKMKTISIEYWNSPNSSATNSSGFTGLPSGFRGIDGDFYGLGYYGTWWSSTEDSSTSAQSSFISYDLSKAYSGEDDKGRGRSVRCLRD